jgi:hypothetical protein
MKQKYTEADVLSRADIQRVTRRADAKGKTVNFKFARISGKLRCVSASYNGRVNA